MDAQTNQPTTIMIEFEIRTPETSVNAWLDVWRARGVDAYEGEPETLAYATAINNDHPNQVVVFERYVNEDRSLDLHRNRPAHRHLLATLGERNMTKRRVTTSWFRDVPDVGWWSRPKAPQDHVEGAIIHFVGLRFETTAKQDAFLRATSQHADYCRQAEPGTLAYGAGIVSTAADRELDQRPGDVAFVAIYADEAAAQAHATDAEHVARQTELAAVGVAVEPTFRRTYRTTGTGFLWRV